VSRIRTEFVCRACGFRTPRALGRCPECETWGSLEPARPAVAAPPSVRSNGAAQPMRLADIDAAELTRVRVGSSELARVLGGGIVPGSLTLIGGDPGVGKSTLLTQIAHDVAQTSGIALYVSGEESLAQSALRARRMGLDARDLLFLSETDVETIVSAVREAAARLVVVDSIQSVTTADVDALPGSVSQLRESTQRFMHLAKSSGTPVFLVGHVTKDGAIAGPKVLEHMVDTVLYLEGERFNQYRLLRSVKNRFGPTHEVGVFEMRGEGLEEVPNPSSVFLTERADASPGSVVTVALEGTRPILVEIQALASKTSLAVPRRTSNGFDVNRLHLIGAVLSRRLGVPLYDQDVYLNVVGGLRVDEPAADLAAALAVISSFRDRPVSSDTVALGEVGLSGELRSVGQLEQRLREAAKLGFGAAVVPRSSTLPRALGDIQLLPATSLREAARLLSL
jgi:DNA repair protein RadA/Sms